MIQVPSSDNSDSGYNCCCPNPTSNNNNNNNNNNKYEKLRRKSLAFLADLFKLRKRNTTPTSSAVSSCLTGMRIDEDSMQRSPRLENPALGGMLCRPRSAPQEHTKSSGNNNNEMSSSTTSVSRIPSTLSVTAVDVVVACRQANITTNATSSSSSSSNNCSRGTSPSHSILTLTPGRTRNIDQDMEALRLSRQDNPYLQVLASKESLIEPVEESESDDAILMSQECLADTDPLTLAQVHEHLVRSPPPASWSRSPIFHFPHQQQHHYHQPQHSPGSKSDSGAHYRTTSPKSGLLHRPTQDDQPKSEGSMETRDRHSHTFSLLNPTPIRSFSEVRRMHRSEDSVQLMSSE